MEDAFVYWVEYGCTPIVYGIYNDEIPIGFMMVAYFNDSDYDDTGVPYYFYGG